MFDPTWKDVESLINDLKNDGYEPTFVTTSTAEPAPEKQVALRFERPTGEDKED